MVKVTPHCGIQGGGYYKKPENCKLSNETWGNASQGQGPPCSTEDHQGEGRGGQGEQVQGGPL